MDKDVVEEAVRKEHGFTDGARATEFLEKIVQVQHPLLSGQRAENMVCTTLAAGLTRAPRLAT